MSDLISRQDAIDAICNNCTMTKAGERCTNDFCPDVRELKEVPSAQPETCEGCKHLGKWENEVEYGYNSPCTGCRRRARDKYAR